MIIESKDLPEHLKRQQAIAHLISEQSFNHIWDLSVEELYKVEKQVDGNSALTYFSTILVGFAGRWIIEMDKIAKKDDAGVETETIIKECLNAIIASLGCTAVLEDEEKPLPDGIKRLRKSS